MTGSLLDRHRRSIRLPRYDYRTPGAYFVTIVSAARECLFDHPALHSVLERCWLAIPRHFAHVTLDAFVVMPNHLHGIVLITADPPQPRSADRAASLVAGSLGAIVGNFKSVTTRRINTMRKTPAAGVWQRNYHERVLRGERELERVRAYIAANPLRWALDRENPQRTAVDDAWNVDEEAWFGTAT
jgi:REP-associated tyrosine transposase